VQTFATLLPAEELQTRPVVGCGVQEAEHLADILTLLTDGGFRRTGRDQRPDHDFHGSRLRGADGILARHRYHKAETLQTLAEVQGVRTYVAEPARGRRHWQDKPAGQQTVVYGNRRRIRGARGRRLGRWRSERAERSFAHVCETGGGRRAWLRGLVNVSKSYLGRVAAHNLGLIMLALFGIGTPRSLQGGIAILFVVAAVLLAARLCRSRLLGASSRFCDVQTPYVGAPTFAPLAVET
jgi:hypothetical protein